MVHLTKIYTKTGDQGMTDLAAGKRVAKTSRRIDAIGCVDELNAFLGFTLASLTNTTQFSILEKQLLRIQNELFNLGSQLAVLLENRRANTPLLINDNIENLENEIDKMNTELPALNSFVLPGGGEIATRLHVARTVCRRAERTVLQLAENETLDGVEVPYLNRLSDWLFVAARFVAVKSGIAEVLWKP